MSETKLTPEERGHACAVEVAKRFGEYINHPAIEIIANAIREAVAAAVEPLMADAYRVAIERDRLRARLEEFDAAMNLAADQRDKALAENSAMGRRVLELETGLRDIRAMLSFRHATSCSRAQELATNLLGEGSDS